MSEDRNDVASGPVGIDDEALGWVIRMAEPQADWDAYLAWLEADPTRAERYDRAALALQDATIAVARLPVSPPATPKQPDIPDAGSGATGWTRRRWLGGAVAAALVGAIGLGVWTGQSDPYIVATAAGEQRTVDLGDGSSIVLAGASQVRLDHKAPRVAVVERGEALFRVRHDPGRPFNGRVGDLALTDLGTVFDVQRLGRRTRVSVAEGAVMVDPDGAALRLDPGQAVIADGASLERQSINAADVGGWRDGRLAYDDATLSEVAEDLSRQLAMRIATAPSVAGRKFRGTLEIGSLRNDPALLGELLGVSVRRTGVAGCWNRAGEGTAAGAGSAFLLMVAAPVAAEPLLIDLPAGSVRQQIMALGRLARVSIVVPDARLWSRRVPALRGLMPASAALSAIAAQAGARVEAIGPGSWRLTRRAAVPSRPPRRTVPSPPTAAPVDVGPDIVVTASKRDTTRANFAGQVVRVSGRDLELGGAGGTERLTQRLTSVTSTYLGAGRNKLFIRGIADSSFTGPTQATVGQYYGDLRLSYNAPDPDLRLADLAAVEVLEGPQGTLYGAGSLGGLIRLVPNPPDLVNISGSAAIGGSATMHGKPGADTQVVLNLPVISERLALRLVANTASEGGYIDKPLRDRVDVNRTRIAGGRATAHLDLGAGWSAEVVGLGQRIRGADSQYADRDGVPLTRSAAVTEGFRSDFAQGQVVLAGRIGDVRLRSTTGVTAHDLMERYDATAPDGPPRLFAQANRTRMQANETRAWASAPDGSGWLAGFSYVHNRTRLTRLYGAPGALVPTTGVVNAITERTLYGEASLRLLPGLLATGGVRVTRARLDGEGEDVPLSLVLPAAITARRTQAIVLPAAAALIDLAPRAKLFLRYQQGFRPGGLAIEGDYVRQFRNDRVATIEAGARLGEPGIDSVDASLTLARASWRDIQADFIDGSGLPSTANIGDGELWTIEGVVGAGMTDGLRLEGAFSYNDGRIEDPSRALIAFATADPRVDSAAARAEILARLKQIPNIARITARGGATYRRQMGDGADLTVDGWLRYVGSSRLGVGPVLGQRQGSYLDSGITGRLGLPGFGITASITNLTNERGNRFALGTPFITGRDQVTPLRPRTVRIGIDAQF